MQITRKIFSVTLVVLVITITLFFSALRASAITNAELGAGIGILNGIANIADRAAKEDKAKQAEKDNQKKLDEQKRNEVRDHIFDTIKNMKGYIKDNDEKEMWKDLAGVLQEHYKAFPKTEQTSTKTVMSITDRQDGVDIIETIVYDKAANLITITVEHKPGFKEEMSDKAK